MRGALILLIGLMLAACGADDTPAPPVPDEATARTIAQGELIGFTETSTGAQVWRGIPFAAAPVGDLRWRAPRPAPAFEGRLEALASSDRCAQMTTPLDQGQGIEPGLLVGREDCLYLDIYAPEQAAEGGDLPVMVWIHGGSNVWGYAAQYDASQLVADQNVIVVVIQYRLGPLGFFAHEAIRDTAGTDLDRGANFALLDQTAALEWVQANISAFGGDEDRVTIFGESAGGYDVAGLLVSPPARGLFHRAIIQSGGLDTVALEAAEQGGEAIVNPSREAAAEFAGGQTAEALRSASLEEIFATYHEGFAFGVELPRMIADGVTLPAEGIREGLTDPEWFNDVPVITGTNFEEMKLFNFLDSQLVRSWFGVLYTARDADFYDALAQYQSRVWRINAVDSMAQSLVDDGHEDVWAYRFDWDEGGRFLFMDLGQLIGSGHAVEIPFVFNRFEFFGRLDRALFTDTNAEGRESLAAAMGGYWAEFARSGNPGAGGGDFPEWPRWDDGGQLMRFDTPQAGGLEVIEGVATFEQLGEDLATDPRLTPEQRCEIVVRIEQWDRSAAQRVRDQVDC
ncbi:para-nitrobenzyl esterase [Marinicauda pacifica]|uniref:Carboxylic ester hydrolase n=1 Tax=Marinicauda pacifica TaxID=1133559 RepID=A0A4V3RZ69_9PROT|nr:carboxylesterase family protein [Marinicauda pacifica]TGY93069.1 hypothetical protein E5162_08385 [Marinicauda pacifica]GGE42553.1 para-nitrobenzyl esterase [Marinicauda pacifica]